MVHIVLTECISSVVQTIRRFIFPKGMRAVWSFCMIMLGMLMCCPSYATENLMTIGVVSQEEGIGLEILRILRSAVFIGLSVFCIKGLQEKNRVVITHFIWLMTCAVLSFLAVNSDRYIGVPDFSYFSVSVFLFCGVGILASTDYLRRVLMLSSRTSLYDNFVFALGVVIVAAITMTAFKNTVIAADILLSIWSSVIIIGSLIAIYLIVSKKIEVDLYLLGWIPAQIGMIVALGVGTNGGGVAVFTSIAAWSSVIFSHGLLVFLGYLNTHSEKSVMVSSVAGHKPQEAVNLVLDKPVFRYMHAKNRIILNQVCAKMLHISGRSLEFSMDAFKGLVAPDFHHVIEKIQENQIHLAEPIKFHSCKKKGLLHPLVLASADNSSETIYLYQDDPRIEPISFISEETSSENFDVAKQDRRQVSDLMFFVSQAVELCQEQSHKSGDYILLLFKIRFYDDWQSVLGIHEATRMLKHITDTISRTLEIYETALVRNFSGEYIGIFSHVASAEGEIDRLKDLILAQFKTPIAVNNQPVFVKFLTGSSKMNVIDFRQTDSILNITNMLDTAKRSIHLIPDPSLIYNPSQMTIPQGANIIGLSSDIRYAPERGQINAMYAPMVDLTQGIVIGFQINSVWRHPDFGLIQDALLSYLSVRSDMENTLDRITIAKAIEGMVKVYRTQKMPVMRFQVTRHRLLNSALDEEIKNLCGLLKIDPALIHLEFTPDCLGSDDKWLAGILTELKVLGVTTVLSGLGSVQGQFASLAGLPIDRIVVDSAFSKNIVNNERKFFTLHSLTKMLSNMAIEADIRDVSSTDSFKPLFNAGIKYISGSAVGLPMPAERAVNLLTKNYEVI